MTPFYPPPEDYEVLENVDKKVFTPAFSDCHRYHASNDDFVGMDDAEKAQIVDHSQFRSSETVANLISPAQVSHPLPLPKIVLHDSFPFSHPMNDHCHDHLADVKYAC